ncbi:hypothetical protein KFE25_010158 [Diacronema lutheri]|mgnify:CR=1 FL=1|uniref:Serine hydrolase domain-containing protein n=1 Tax=Diacronema lutheri TaxID=2081491 RepID=A0A8J5XKN0_DIALT|nr:hypothetical protein KFE25_010158 [Diacronema lutheri]
MSRLRVLCLHGYTQDAERFSRVLSLGLRPHVRDVAELVFVDAPHAARDPAGGRAWWHPELVSSGASKSWAYGGWEETLDFLRDVDRARGPFEGLLGFSQGAAVASSLAAHLTSPSAKPSVSFRFAILAGGFAYRGQGAGALFRHKPLRMPSLHLYGERDKLVKPTSSEELARLFDSPTVHIHPGGHSFPQTQPSLDIVAEFLRAQGEACAGTGGAG